MKNVENISPTSATGTVGPTSLVKAGTLTSLPIEVVLYISLHIHRQ